MRVLLVVTKYGYPDPSPHPELFPQGIAYVAGALKAGGHEVFGCNMSYTLTRGSAYDLLARSLRQSIAECQPHAIALGGLSADYRFLSDAIAVCRQLAPHVPLILGGGIVAADRDYILSALRPDFAISGDAELTICELLAALETGGELRQIEGVSYWQDGNPVVNCDRRESKDMPAYPWPCYDGLGLEDFFQASSHRHAAHLTTLHPRPRIFPVSAGRSCPFKCTFCFHSNGAIYKQRPIPDVLAEIAHFHAKYAFNILLVYDELFSVKESRVREFCAGMRSLDLGIRWSCAMRVPDVHADLLRDMKDAGCAMVGFGVESASDVVLQSMRKKISRAQVEAAIEAADRAGMGFQANVIYGDPAETAATVQDTAEFCESYADHVIYQEVIIPFPATPIFADCIRRGVIVDKKDYYENPRLYNMTTVPSPQFEELVGQAIIGQHAKIRWGQVEPVLFLLVQPAQGLDEYPRTSVLAQVHCPHCGTAMERILDYPGNVQDVRDGKEQQISAFLEQAYDTPCPSCYRRFFFRIGIEGKRLVEI